MENVVELSEPQLQALEAQPSTLLRVVNPRNQEAYVLVRAELFSQMQEDAQDQCVQSALLKKGRAAAVHWMKDNPF